MSRRRLFSIRAEGCAAVGSVYAQDEAESKSVFEKPRPQAVLPLTQDARKDAIVAALKVEDAGILAHEIPVFRMNGYQRVQRTTAPGKLSERLNALFQTGDDALSSIRIAKFLSNMATVFVTLSVDGASACARSSARRNGNNLCLIICGRCVRLRPKLGVPKW